MGDSTGPTIFPGRNAIGSGRSLNAHGRSNAAAAKQYDPNEDDPVEHTGSIKGAASEQPHYIIAPSIQVRSEFSSLTRSSESSQPLTCIVVIELPGKRLNTHVPGQVIQREAYPPSETSSLRMEGGVSRQEYNMQNQIGMGLEQSQPSQSRSQLRMSPAPSHSQHSQSQHSQYNSNGHEEQPLYHQQDEDSPFNAITEDLRNRIIDWKGHPLSGLGPLQMYDLLSVRRDAMVREFFVYLFKEAIICVVEEKKRTLGRLLSSASGAASAFGDGAMGSSVTSPAVSKGVLRLKGRIYIRHIKHVTDTSVTGELSLTIDMEDERLDSFILIFKDRSSLETWRTHIQTLVAVYQHMSAQAQQPPPSGLGDGAPDLEEFGPGRPPARLPDEFGANSKAVRMLTDEFSGNSKAMRVLSGSTATTMSTADSLLNGSSRSTVSSHTSYGSGNGNGNLGPRPGYPQKLSTLEEDDELSRYSSPAPLVAPHLSAGPSNSLTPLPHVAMDLILVISIPPPNATPSTAALKVRVIRTSLDFLIASLGPRDRLSLVTFEVGLGGRVRKTPFLCVGKAQSRARLTKFVDELGRRDDGTPFQDEFLVRSSQDDKTDVVTAVNHGTSICSLSLNRH